MFYGGAQGGGKSFALLIAALMFVSFPNYNALLLRRTYQALSLPDALMDIAHQWLDDTDAYWHEDIKTWDFPSGATLTFGHFDSSSDERRYKGSQFHFIGFDELTQFTESQYTDLLLRLRAPTDDPIPKRMRSASNPGDIGHEFVKSRFIYGSYPFVPATLADNPHLDQEHYRELFERVDHIKRRQLLYGDWDIRPDGDLFKRGWFEVVKDYPHDARTVRYWDLASTEKGDYTAGVKVAEKDGVYYVLDVVHIRERPKAVEDVIKQTAELDGTETEVYMEQEPGSSGLSVIDHYARSVLLGFTFRGSKTTGSKVTRASPVSAAAEMGNVKLVKIMRRDSKQAWIDPFLDELVVFPSKNEHDDQVDALSGAIDALTSKKKRISGIVPITGRIAGRPQEY